MRPRPSIQPGRVLLYTSLFIPSIDLPLIRPFRALRYGHDHLAQLAALVSPCGQGAPNDPGEVGDVHPHSIRQLVRGDFGYFRDRRIRGWVSVCAHRRQENVSPGVQKSFETV